MRLSQGIGQSGAHRVGIDLGGEDRPADVAGQHEGDAASRHLLVALHRGENRVEIEPPPQVAGRGGQPDRRQMGGDALGAARRAKADAFRSAMRKADFTSLRGKFALNTNQHPIQDLYLMQIEKGPDGQLGPKVVRRIVIDDRDAYASACKMAK